jgi:hypothetical protein
VETKDGMKTKPSKKHHYLPRYYLKGFTDKEGSFFVYDKHADKIFPTSPDTAFFENDLNTVILPDGSSSDFLERFYTEIENQSWSSLDSIRNFTPNTPIELSDRMNLFLFGHVLKVLIVRIRLGCQIRSDSQKGQ